MFGMPRVPLGLFGVADGSSTRPTNTEEDMASLQKTYADVMARNRTPNGRVERGFAQFGPVTPQAMPMPSEAPPPVVPPLPAPINVGSGGNVAAPQDSFLGPHSVGGAPINPVSDGSFNSLDAQASDPSGPSFGSRIAAASGALRDTADTPSNQANGQMPNSPFGPQQVNGPDLIHKFMAYLHNK